MTFLRVTFAVGSIQCHLILLNCLNRGVLSRFVSTKLQKNLCFNSKIIFNFQIRIVIQDFMILGGHSTFFAMLNSFVHIVMYFYYMVAAMGPQYQKFIWWKKYLTTFQMVSISNNGFYWIAILICITFLLGSIRCHLYASIPIAVPRLWLPKGFHGMDRSARCHVPVPVLRLLQVQVHVYES